MTPIYRAKKIDSNEWVEGLYYINGYISNHIEPYINKNNVLTLKHNDCYFLHEVDPKTLSINFPTMIDKSSKKIFASFNEDGIGGDIVNRYEIYNTPKRTSRFYDSIPVFIKDINHLDCDFSNPNQPQLRLEIIGINKG